MFLNHKIVRTERFDSKMDMYSIKNDQIPKKIHMFWFGRGKKDDIINKCIESWRVWTPDWQIIEWNEDNFDVNFCERSREAYAAKKWAFVADIARLKFFMNMEVFILTQMSVYMHRLMSCLQRWTVIERSSCFLTKGLLLQDWALVQLPALRL